MKISQSDKFEYESPVWEILFRWKKSLISNTQFRGFHVRKDVFLQGYIRSPDGIFGLTPILHKAHALQEYSQVSNEK